MNLCLGTVQFGMDYGIQGAVKPSYEKAEGIIRYAVSQGIHAFDSAPAYGEAEGILGCYIKQNGNISRDLQVVSKLAPNIFEGVPKVKWNSIVEKNAKRSLRLLGIKKLWALLFHNAAMIYDRDAVCALDTVRSSGLAEKAGVSVYTPDEALQALEYDEMKVIQVPYNVFDHRLDQCGFFEKAKKKGIEVYARSTLLQGLLVMEAELLPEKVKFAKEYLLRFQQICSKYSVSRIKAAVGYVKKHKGIDYIVFGTDNLAQLEEYVAMQKEDIPEEMISELCREFDVVEERLINPAMW